MSRFRGKDEYAHLYKTKRWQDTRKRILIRDMYQCQECGTIVGIRKYDAHVDHKIAHKGDDLLFWNEDNMQTLCHSCHNSDKQREERTGRARVRIGKDGWPI